MDETGERAGARGTREQGAGGGRAGGDEMGYTVGWGGSAFYDPPTPPRGDPTKRHQVFLSLCHLRSLLFYPPLNFSNVNFLVFLFS